MSARPALQRVAPAAPNALTPAGRARPQAERWSAEARRRRLLQSFQEDGDLAAREVLVADCLPLVSALARDYANRGEQIDDLMQVASIGLLKAIDRFDPGRGVEFTRFATTVMAGEIRHHLRDKVRPIRIPRRLRDLYVQLYLQREELTTVLGRSPTNLEVGSAAGVSEQDVFDALQTRLAFQPKSLSTSDGIEEGEEVMLLEVVGADDPAYGASENRLLLASTLQRLSVRERRVLYLRYHHDLTQRRIASELGLSQMHISRILRKALDTLAEPVKSG